MTSNKSLSKIGENKKLSLMYRGHLVSCNYACGYCPFAKRPESKLERTEDKVALERFTSWLELTEHYQLSVFFTPWGEALVRKYYQDALCQLSQLEHIERVAIQTNFSWDLTWLERCNIDKLGLWLTFHPTEISIDKFLKKCVELKAMGVRFSVGMVALRDSFELMEQMRDALPPDVYLWLNAYDKAKRSPEKLASYYSTEQLVLLEKIDPYFRLNTKRYDSLGKSCRTGEDIVSVDGEGSVRRCHFIQKVLGNIYTDDIEQILKPRVCSRQYCDCHIGYVHLDELDLYDTFTDSILERIPQGFHWS